MRDVIEVNLAARGKHGRTLPGKRLDLNGRCSIVSDAMTTTPMAPPYGRGDRLTGAAFATRAPVIAKNGMVASAHPLATGIGLDVLKAGGTAVDAAIAVNAALGLMEATACGIGGDMFAIVWDPKTRALYGYNGSGRSAKGRSYDDLVRKLTGKKKIPPAPSTAGSRSTKNSGRSRWRSCWRRRRLTPGTDFR
jgi:gamma-glutamyltranspeptidase/glutathione hydrolase